MRRAEKIHLVSESRLRQLEHASTKSDILNSVKQPNEQQLVKKFRRITLHVFNQIHLHEHVIADP